MSIDPVILFDNSENPIGTTSNPLKVVEAQGAALYTLNITMAGAAQQLPSNATPNSGFIQNESATNMRVAPSSAVSATVGFLLQPGAQHPILTQNMSAYYLFGTGAVSVIWAV